MNAVSLNQTRFSQKNLPILYKAHIIYYYYITYDHHLSLP